MTDEERALKQAIERLYEVFASYPLQPSTFACRSCHTWEEERLLHQEPLRELTHSHLEKYAFDALLTWGDVDGFKHFLPRLFELLWDGDWLVEPEVLLGKLPYGDWRDWPVDEQGAVEGFLTALWRWFLTEASHADAIGDLLCGLGHAVDDVSPFLAVWRSAGLIGQSLLAGFVIDEAEQIAKRRLGSAFWSDRRAQMAQVIEWIIEPSTKAAVENAYLSNASDPLAEDLATAVDCLDMIVPVALLSEWTEDGETHNS